MSCIKCSRDASFAFFLVFFVMFIIAFSTPYWYTVRSLGVTYNVGLWSWCKQHLDNCQNRGSSNVSELKSTRAMMCIAFILYGLSTIAYCIWISKGRSYLRRRGAGIVGMTALIAALAGGIFNIIGSAIFGDKYGDDIFDMDWHDDEIYLHGSFICAAISGVMQVLISVITLPVMTCCFKPEPAASTPATGTTAIVMTETHNAPGTADDKPNAAGVTAPVVETTIVDNTPATAVAAVAAAAGPYVPPGDYPPKGQYPLAGGHPAPIGVYPAPGGYPVSAPAPAPGGYPASAPAPGGYPAPAPGGYPAPAPGGYPPVGGYPPQGGFPPVQAFTNQADPPPPYAEKKDDQRL